MNQNIFKAYDIRGKYPVEINEEIAGEIISSFISKIKNQISKIKIIVGRDARLSSPMLYRAAIKSIKHGALDIKIIEAGLMTTPMLYFLVNHFKTDLGIMITASHNPKEYNGLKIVGKNAIPISGEEIYKVVMKDEK
jgi:phosphomannomutase